MIKPEGLKNSLRVQFTLPRNVPMIFNKEMKRRGSIICQNMIRPVSGEHQCLDIISKRKTMNSKKENIEISEEPEIKKT